MAHTQQSVLKALGKEAQVSGGTIVVYRGGKHIAVSKFVEGVFFVTPEGLELLESPQITTDEGVDVVVNPRGGNGGKRGGKGKQEPEAEVVVEAAEEVVAESVAVGVEGVDFDLGIAGLDEGGNE